MLLLERIGSAVCHQMAERSFLFDGMQMPLCARCTGIYTGVFFAFCFFFLKKRMNNRKPFTMPQAFLMAAAKQTLQLSNLDKLKTYAEIFHRNVSTDLEPSNILWLGEQALTAGSENISFHTLPGDGAGWYNGGSYYILDDLATLELINTYFNPLTRDITLDETNILVP